MVHSPRVSLANMGDDMFADTGHSRPVKLFSLCTLLAGSVGVAHPLPRDVLRDCVLHPRAPIMLFFIMGQ